MIPVVPDMLLVKRKLGYSFDEILMFTIMVEKIVADGRTTGMSVVDSWSTGARVLRDPGPDGWVRSENSVRVDGLLVEVTGKKRPTDVDHTTSVVVITLPLVRLELARGTIDGRFPRLRSCSLTT